MSDENRFAPDGTLLEFRYLGSDSKMEHPLTKKLYPLTPKDTLLYEGILKTNKISYNPYIQYASNDPTLHRIRSPCPKCTRPIREHLMTGDVSILSCRCNHIETTQ